MFQVNATVDSLERVGEDIHVLRIRTPEIASRVLPGQFVNIRVHDLYQPLLRRPFSVSRTFGDSIEILFNIVGAGTGILSSKRKGDSIDLIGPLGCSFDTQESYETAVLIAGGMGVAPLPILTDALRGFRKIATFVGARSKKYLVTNHLENCSMATDDGSFGFHGTVVDLLRVEQNRVSLKKPKIFACGPQPMLKAVSRFAEEFNIPCEISLESSMACGFGICQGCPVENAGGGKKYSLICKDGPVFNSRSVILS